MKQIDKPIEDKKWAKFFDLPIDLYEKSSFLRNIKQAYIRFGNLSDKQIEAFKKTVKDLKNPKPKEDETTAAKSEEKVGESAETKKATKNKIVKKVVKK